MTTNCRDLNPSDLKNFPVAFSKIGVDVKSDLERLTDTLMIDYQKNSEMKEKKSKLTGEVSYQEFYPRLSKPILDAIDTLLASHYGFTPEELDFIINYDIKYRMGRGSGEEAWVAKSR